MSKGREIADYGIHRWIGLPLLCPDRKTVNAVIRSLEVLGEATKHIPASYRKKHPEIPWSKMAGMRDVLIHDYMGVDLKTVWNVVTERLPELQRLLLHHL